MPSQPLLVTAIAGTASASSRHTSVAAPKPATAAQWKALVAKAQQEGSVTIYTVSNPTSYANMAAAFKAKYGITVTVNRNVDNAIVAQINAEESTGKAVADIWVATAKPYIYGALNHRWVVDPVGPSFFSKKFNRKTFMFGKAWISGEAVLGEAWNTQAYKGSISGVPDFTNSAFSGKIGVPDPRVSTSFMDWYLWAEKKWGTSILQKLAAQNPKIYTSTLPMTQAVASGEIIGAPVRRGNCPHAQGGGSADRVQGPPGQLERAVLRDDPEAGSAPGGGSAARQLHGVARGAGLRLGHRRRHLPEHPQYVLLDTASAAPERLHEGEGRCLQRPVGVPLHPLA